MEGRGRGSRRQKLEWLCAERAAGCGLDLTTRRSRPEPKPGVGHSTDNTTQVPHQTVVFNKTTLTFFLSGKYCRVVSIYSRKQMSIWRNNFKMFSYWFSTYMVRTASQSVFLTKGRKPSEVKARGLTGRSCREGVWTRAGRLPGPNPVFVVDI